MQRLKRWRWCFRVSLDKWARVSEDFIEVAKWNREFDAFKGKESWFWLGSLLLRLFHFPRDEFALDDFSLFLSLSLRLTST